MSRSMDLKQLINDDDAVSPVIGVILMVAITVILAAVIASFVLGLGDQAQQQTPQASFSFDFSEGSPNELDITHDGGDTITANELYVRGSSLGTGNTGTWASLGSLSPSSDVTAGNGITLSGPSTSYEVRVVYESQEGDNSATLAQDEGPDA